jgi:nucleoside-diphosphate-sugar epimerase
MACDSSTTPRSPEPVSSPVRVLIAGCGDVGGALARLLLPGHQVWGLRRDAARLPPGVMPIAGDLTRVGALALPEVDQVVYCAAANRADEQAYRAVYIEGLRGLIDRLRRQVQPLRRLVFCSSTSVYGQNDGDWVDHASPAEPNSYPGRIMLEAERLLLESQLPGTVLRLAGIYGPGRDRLLEAARSGPPTVDQTAVFGNRIHRDDCAGMLAHILGLERPAPCYLGVDDAPAPMAEVIAHLRGLMDAAAIPLAWSDRANWPQRGGNKRCSNRLIRESGYRLLFPDYRSGYAELLAPWWAARVTSN